jgi:hypothetical protein
MLGKSKAIQKEHQANNILEAAHWRTLTLTLLLVDKLKQLLEYNSLELTTSKNLTIEMN